MRDLLVLCICFFLVLATWLLLGWGPDLFVGSYDFLMGHYPLTKLMMRNHFQHVNFSETILAGAYISPVWGSSLVYEFLYRLGFDAGTILNASVFIAQSLIVYFTNAIYEFNSDQESSNDNLIYRLFVCTLMMGFNPLLIWRVEHGHLPFLWAMVFFLGLMVVVFCVRLSKRPSPFLLIALWIGMSNALTQQAYQLVFYASAVAFVLLACSRALTVKKLVFYGIFFLSILLFILPDFKMMMDFSRSEFSSRGVDVKAVYTYLVTSIRDVDTLFVMNKNNLLTREPFILHEIHYPVLAASILLLLFRKRLSPYLQKLALFLSVSGVLVFAAACKPPGLGTLVESLPMISSFRIIGRANIVIGLGLYLLLTITLLTVEVKNPLKFGLLALVVFFRFYTDLNPDLEVLLWIGVAVSFALDFLGKKNAVTAWEDPAIGILAILALFFASQSIWQRGPYISQIEDQIHTAEDLLLKAGVGENASLYYTGGLKDWIGPNVYMALGQKSVEGYWQATPEYNRFYSESLKIKVDPMQIYFPVVNPEHLAKLDEGFSTQFIAIEKQDKLNVMKNKPGEIHSVFAKEKPFLPAPVFSEVTKSAGVLLLFAFLFFSRRITW